jgi:hypothetical protein
VDNLTGPAAQVRAALEEIFTAVSAIGDAFAAHRDGCLASGTALTPDRLAGLREVIWQQLGMLPAADGAGVVAASGVVAGKQRHLEWWQRTGAAPGGQDGYARIRLNLDPESIDLYDYLEMDWFTVPRDEGRRSVYGPQFDFSGADRYVLTLTVPVFGGAAPDRGQSRRGVPPPRTSGGRVFLGVAGTDIRMSHLEPSLLAILRTVPAPAVLVTAERRVVAANTPRWISGTRLDRLPSSGDGVFGAVTGIGADSGWVLATALRLGNRGVQVAGVQVAGVHAAGVQAAGAQVAEEVVGGELAAADGLVERVKVGVTEAAGGAEGRSVVFEVAQVTARPGARPAAGVGQRLRDRGAAEGRRLLGPAAGQRGLEMRLGMAAVRRRQPRVRRIGVRPGDQVDHLAVVEAVLHRLAHPVDEHADSAARGRR